MATLTLEVPESLLDQLKQQAVAQKRRLEEWIVERLAWELGEKQEETLEERLDRFYADSDLFEQPTEEEKQQYQHQLLTEEELEEIGRKLAAAGPLSEVIIEERRQGY